MMSVVSVNKYLLATVKNYAAKIAFEDSRGTLSFGVLESRSNSVARLLKKAGVRKGDRVGIYLENSIEYIICIIAIIKLAAIYVPLNIRLPRERLSEILQDCQPVVVFTLASSLQKFADFPLKVITVDDTSSDNSLYSTFAEGFLLDDSNIDENSDEKNIAYIIYTSGSTGKSKGVAIRNDSLINFIEASSKTFGFSDHTCNFNISPYYFDGTVGSIFTGLKVASYLFIYVTEIVIPKVIINRIIEKGITHLGCTPGFFKLFITNLSDENIQSLKLETIGLGGGKCPIQYFKECREKMPNVRLFNRYGPTETTVIVSGKEISQSDIDKGIIPIGKPEPNVFMYIFDTEGKRIKQSGEVGELYIGGVQVMEGYWNDQELTQSVFIRDRENGMLLYRTGDLALLDDDGNFIFAGRADDMVKRHGFRIFLSEIENLVNSFDWVKESACIVYNIVEDNPKLVLFLNTIVNLDKSEIVKRLRDVMPVYMLPDKIKVVTDLPYSDIGKIDYKKLRKLYTIN